MNVPHAVQQKLVKLTYSLKVKINHEKNTQCNHRHFYIETELFFSEDPRVSKKALGNLLCNFYCGCVRNTDVYNSDRIKMTEYI